MFEVGADTGDTPGEYQYWVEREHLDTVLPFPAGYHDLRLNPKTGVLGVLTGVGTARTAATIMALGLDPRFDLTHAYFLVAGIGGIDPQMGSLASAVWSDYIVDGDLAHEIDAREIPQRLEDRLRSPRQIHALRATPHRPLRRRRQRLPPQHRARRLGLQPHQRHAAPRHPADQRAPHASTQTPPPTARPSSSAATISPPPPSGTASCSTSGPATGSNTRPTATAPTPSAAWKTPAPMQSLTWLAKANKLDINRVLVLRTASNFDQQRIGVTAAESLSETKVRQYSAYLPALDNAYRVGHIVVDNLVANWPQTRDHIP